MDPQKLIHSQQEDPNLTEHPTAIERIIFQQLDLMRQQLEALQVARANGQINGPLSQPMESFGTPTGFLVAEVSAAAVERSSSFLLGQRITESVAQSEPNRAPEVGEIEKLSYSDSNPQEETIFGEKGETKGRIPLTEAQQEIWLASKFSDTASCAFNESTVFYFRGIFHRQVMKGAFQQIVQRHDALRTTFDSGGEFQYLSPSVAFDIPIFDFSELTESHRKEKVVGILKEDVSQPFDLERGPLFRSKILKLSENYHLMLITAHHAVCDGWSFDVLVRDLSTAYNILIEGRSDDRPLPSMQFSDFAKLQEKSRDSADALVAEKYWLSQFEDSIPILELPSDRQRPPVKSYQGAREIEVLDDAVYSQIKKLGARQGATLFSTLLTVFSILLYRLTGQGDLVIGMLAAGQSASGSQDLVGHCTNLLPLRVHLNGQENFRELLASIKKLVLDAFDHQSITFGRLLRRLDIKRDPSRTPLVSVLFNIDPAIRGMRFNHLEMEYGANPRCAYQFDIGFNLVAHEHMLESSCDYTSDLFDAETIKRWLVHYHALIASIVRSPELPVALFPILNESEQHQLISTWNETSVAYPSDACVNNLFEMQAERVPNAVAVLQDDKSISYRELDQRADKLAHYLQTLGVKAETFVGVFMNRSIDTVVGLLGIMKAGGAYLPLDPDFPQDRLAFMLEDSATAIILTQSELLESLPPHNAKVVVLDQEWDRIGLTPDYIPESVARSVNLAYLMYTSGSTGKPKGVQIPHGAVVNFLLSMRDKPGFSEKDKLLSVTTLSFDISVLEVFLPLITGGSLVLVSHQVASDGKLLSESLARYKPSVMQATPVTWLILLESGWHSHGPLKALIGGEPLPAELCNRLLEQGVEVWNMYGPTETTIWSTIKKMDPSQKRVSIGRPIANTQTYVLDQNMLPVPIGVTGELHIGGDGLARGYLNRPELTSEKFMANPFNENPNTRLYKTGDLAFYLPNGDLQCLGRTDFQTKVRGFRVEPGEIESLLNRHPSIEQSAVVVRPDPLGENQLVAHIVAKGGSRPAVPDLRQYLGVALPDYMVPSRFFFLEAMPLTPNGKINRKALPAVTDQGNSDLDKSFVAANDSLEMQLTKIWESVLGIKRIGIKDNFFEIGGHSLLAARLFSRIEKTMGLNLPLATLFQAPTIDLLARIIRHKDWSDNWSSLVPIRPGGSKPPLFLVHGAGGNVLLYRELAIHLGAEQPLYGLQAKGLDGNNPYFERIEDMAIHYVQEVRSLQPEGPYYLGGYCLGGAIALEMAQQLIAQGQEVAFLTMIETYNVRFGNVTLPFYYDLFNRLQNLKYHWDNLWLLSMRDKITFLSKKSQTEMGRLKSRMSIVLSQLAQKLRLPLGEQYPHVNLSKINDQAHLKYSPKTYEGRIALFRPKTHYAGYTEHDFGWGGVAQGGVEVHVLQVNPRGSLVEPFVQELARELNYCLEKITGS
jgi:amino acid adenylation domain-containing protein